MTLLRLRLTMVMLCATAGFLCGCPTPPLLEVSRGAITFGTESTSSGFDIRNNGGSTLQWQLAEVVRANAESPWENEEVDWFSADKQSGSATENVERVTLTANRSGLPTGEYNNTGVRISSNGGEEIIPVSMIISPTLAVTPKEFALSSTATNATFSVINEGTDEITWTVWFLDDPAHPENAREIPTNILISPNPGSTLPGTPTTVGVQWETGQEDFYLLVRSEAGSEILSFRFGAALEGLEVAPDTLRLYVDSLEVEDDASQSEQAPSTLRIRNRTAVTRSWSLELRNTLSPDTAPAISATPATGTTSAGNESEIEVKVTDVTNIKPGAGNYEILVRSNNTFLVVPIIVEVMPPAKIAISEAPQENTSRPEIMPLEVLDFKKDELQLAFWVANVGARGSNLYFRVTHEDEDSDTPLIVGVTPKQNGVNGEDGDAQDFYHPDISNLLIDGTPVTITVDRSNMTEDVEFRTITVQAMDENFENVIDAVEEKTLQIRVERPPLKMEGAINRSRPPYVMRFAFLLRDSFGEVISTRTEEDMERISFTVTEDSIPLDLDETALYVTGPENLKVNLILMLDFTGSMYYAGTQGAALPLPAGQAIEDVKSAAAAFLDDLPASYRVALMYYYDRQQPNRLLHAFSTDRSSLKKALQDFHLPVALHGVSDIRDALQEGITLLQKEDAEEVLPFDDADVRSIVFVTDGRDNASSVKVNELSTYAQDNRVRLYPLVYNVGDDTDVADMLVLAEESGGHMFSAGAPQNLATLLGNEKGLALTESTITGDNMAVFNVANVGNTQLVWQITGQDDVDWIDSLSITGGPLPAASRDALNRPLVSTTPVTVRVDPSVVVPNTTVVGKLSVTSNNGEGEIVVRMSVGADNTTATAVALELHDEPGRLWAELQNQIVLTYITPLQAGAQYSIRTEYKTPEGQTLTTSFERDGVFFPGDVRAGQLAMYTTGIVEDVENNTNQAEVYVRTDYTPRGVNRFRMRFFLSPEEDTPAAAVTALQNAIITAELAPDGLLLSDDPFAPTWRLIPRGDNVYDLLTPQDNPLPYGSFGNLLRLSITNLEDFVAAMPDAVFRLAMRCDNEIYISPASPQEPEQSKFFLYPTGPTNPDRLLAVGSVSDLAPPANTGAALANPGIDPEAEFAWDRDEDGLPDFNDPYPDEEGQPGTLVSPNPFEIDASIDEATLTLRNNRLDSYSYTIALQLDNSLPQSLAGRVTLLSPDSGSLAPGESTTIQLRIDRTGLPAAFYTNAALLLSTDVFGVEKVPLTIIITDEKK